MINKDIYFMQKALNCAKKAYNIEEVPIGAVIVKDNKIIAKGYNKSITLQDSTAHAEIIAIRKACKKLNNYRLNDCSIYVTIEPCSMCVGALILSRIKKIYFGAKDIKAGGCGSVFNIASDNRLNHKIEVSSGLLEEECARIIKQFFQSRR
ncbi:MAG: tRNA adenosine(34) deaminase TadA [Endomicrobiia bacterium]